MKIIKEMLGNYFSQLGLLEIIVYLIAFVCISGFSIAVSVYYLWMKNSLTQYAPTKQEQNQYRQINTMNQTTRQAPTEDIEEVSQPINLSNVQSRKYHNEVCLPEQKKKSHTHFGSRRR